MKRVAALALSLALGGCGAGGAVVRIYDGRVVEGSYVPPDAYAAYLRGVLAEESGDLGLAVASYADAARLDDDDPEVWARLGEARCKANPADRAADDALSHALRVDGLYAGALAAASRCASLRGKNDLALSLAAKAAAEDPWNVTLDALLVRAEARRGDPRSRERAVALTLAHADSEAAWDALVTWGRARADAELVARGLVGLLRSAPGRSAEVERGARELFGEGHLARARVVAAAVADAPREALVRGPRDGTVARLAVDEALARGDEATARRRATAGHVDLAEVAARALILERRDVALDVARGVAHADPGASAARMVLAAIEHDARRATRTQLGEEPLRVADDPPEICALVLADRIAGAAGAEVARGWLTRVLRRPAPAHDPLAGPLAVDLAARGVLLPADLPSDLKIELAARRREAPPLPAATDDLDARHELLFLSLTDPQGTKARGLFARLSGAVGRDPVVAFAFARMALAESTPRESTLALLREAVAAAPIDPLLLSAAVEIAKRVGRAEDLAPARTRLMSVARTPAEHALATE